MGYEKSGNEELSLLTPWQLVNKVYEKMLVEAKSIKVMVADFYGQESSTHGVGERIDSSLSIVTATGQVAESIHVLAGLLADDNEKDREFNETMRGLYRWVLDLIAVIRDTSCSAEKRVKASEDLITQCEGFLKIWSEVAH